MKKVRYLHIKTQADLRNERRRVSEEMEELEENLRDDYRSIAEMFSITYVAGRIAEKTSTVYTIIEYALSGYRFIRNFYERQKAGKETPPSYDTQACETPPAPKDGTKRSPKRRRARNAE